MNLKSLTWTEIKNNMSDGYSANMWLFSLMKDDSVPKCLGGPFTFLSANLPLAGKTKFKVVNFEEGRKLAEIILKQFIKDLHENG